MLLVLFWFQDKVMNNYFIVCVLTIKKIIIYEYKQNYLLGGNYFNFFI